METKSLHIDIPLDILTALNIPETELVNDIRLTMAIQFYRAGRLSLGKAAVLAGVSRYEFELKLIEKQLPISNLTLEDIQSDIEKLKEL